MSKPTKPAWAYADPSTSVIEPEVAKQQVGWLAGEKPPNQHMNWIHYETKLWIDFFESKTENDTPTMLRCSASLTWSGTTLTFSQPIKISFRVTEGEQINQIPNADSPIAMNDGDVLVLFRDKDNASPVSLSIAASYAALDAGQYVVVAESSLAADNAENETVIFRRVGSTLEVVPTGTIYNSGEIFNLGRSSVSSNLYLPPIGTIIPFYDFNGALTFNTTIWKYCDGTAGVTIGGIGAQTLPDLSNRYLVGFGTDGGGDIDTAAWATAVVGAASHQVDLSHTHTSAAHTHTMGNHTHSVPAHYHAKGTLAIGASGSHNHSITRSDQGLAAGGGSIHCSSTNAVVGNNIGPYNTASNTHSHVSGDFSGLVGNTGASDGDAAMTSGAPSSNTSDSTTPGATGTSGSAAQSIQPRSIRVRFIMRVA